MGMLVLDEGSLFLYKLIYKMEYSMILLPDVYQNARFDFEFLVARYSPQNQFICGNSKDVMILLTRHPRIEVPLCRGVL